MYPKPNKQLEACRITDGPLKSDRSAGNNGAFVIRGPHRTKLGIIASDGGGWEHVSVSTKNRTPTWTEMCFVKDLFWNDEETVVQFHPRKSQYVNDHPYCLHLWRPTFLSLPEPPHVFV
jgi:hypothetical protein